MDMVDTTSVVKVSGYIQPQFQDASERVQKQATVVEISVNVQIRGSCYGEAV